MSFIYIRLTWSMDKMVTVSNWVGMGRVLKIRTFTKSIVLPSNWSALGVIFSFQCWEQSRKSPYSKVDKCLLYPIPPKSEIKKRKKKVQNVMKRSKFSWRLSLEYFGWGRKIYQNKRERAYKLLFLQLPKKPMLIHCPKN